MKKPYLTFKVVGTEILGWLVNIAALVITIIKAATTSGKIPTNYNFAGEVTNYGSAWTMLMIPCTMIFVAVVCSVMLHVTPASSWNLSVKVTPENEDVVHTDFAFLVTLEMLESGVFALLTPLLFGAGGLFVGIAAGGYCVVVTITLVIGLVIIKADSKRV